MSNEVDPTQPAEEAATAPANEEAVHELTEDELEQIAGGTGIEVHPLHGQG